MVQGLSKRFSRQQLYDLVWSEPMSKLAKQYDITDRGLAKACAKSNIPVPERGYWNKLNAGHKVTRKPLPPRAIGTSDEVTIGGYSHWYYNRESDEKILNNPIPPPPEFESSLDDVRDKAEKLVKKASFPKTLDKPHRLIAKMLGDDEKRRQKKQGSGYWFSWDGPFFDTPFEQRRLRILNALFTGLEQCGMKPAYHGKQARDLSVKVGDQAIHFSLESMNVGKQLERERQGYSFEERGHKDPMQLVLAQQHSTDENIKKWVDDENGKIENFYRDIAIEIIVKGETRYRDSEIRHHEWLIEHKSDLLEKKRLRLIEEERQRVEKRKKYEQACIDQLLGQANSFRQANEIRSYVEVARKANSTSGNPLCEQEFESWAEWALEQADRIDPVKSGQFKLCIAEPE